MTSTATRWAAAVTTLKQEEPGPWLGNPDDVERVPSGGIGGTSGGVKCLHAHLAEYLVLGRSPAGRVVHDEIMPLDCAAPCVVVEGDHAEKNPAYREPR